MQNRSGIWPDTAQTAPIPRENPKEIEKNLVILEVLHNVRTFSPESCWRHRR
jgi:hypothetical protein